MGQIISHLTLPVIFILLCDGRPETLRCFWRTLLAEAFELRPSRCASSARLNRLGEPNKRDSASLVLPSFRMSSQTLSAVPVRSAAVSLDRPIYISSRDPYAWTAFKINSKSSQLAPTLSDWNFDSLSAVPNLLLGGVGLYAAMQGAAALAQVVNDVSIGSKRRGDFQDDDNDNIASKKRTWLPRPLRVLRAKASAIAEPLQRLASRVVRGPVEPLNRDDWSVCTLESASEESPGYVRYRFQLGKPNNVLPITVGQEIVLCMMDNRERVLKGAFFPVTDATSPGRFEVVCRTVNEDLVALPMALSTEDKFQRALSRAEIGDELAVRPGKHRLNGPRAHSSAASSLSRRPLNQYAASVSAPPDVSRVLMICAGDGITPAVQLMKRFLSGSTSAAAISADVDGEGVLADVVGPSAAQAGVDEVNLVWLNDREEDFVCQEEIDHFELGHSNKFTVRRLLEDDLFSPELMRDRRIYTSMSPYAPGDLAVICAQEHLVEQFRFLLQELGYPHEAIVNVVM